MSEYNSTVVTVHGEAFAGGADFLHSASLSLNNAALSQQIKEGRRRLQPQIQRLMPARKTSTTKGPSLVGDSGVLVVVIYWESEWYDATGNKPKIFKSMEVAGRAAYAEFAIKQYNSISKLTSGKEGWREQYIYIWVTP